MLRLNPFKVREPIQTVKYSLTTIPFRLNPFKVREPIQTKARDMRKGCTRSQSLQSQGTDSDFEEVMQFHDLVSQSLQSQGTDSDMNNNWLLAALLSQSLQSQGTDSDSMLGIPQC